MFLALMHDQRSIGSVERNQPFVKAPPLASSETEASMQTLSQAREHAHRVPLTSEFLDRIRVGLMGWLTILLVTMGIAGLVGVNWVHFGRR
jgi:hypothetical protein